MTNNDNPINDEGVLPFERVITNSEFEKFRAEGFLKETNIYYGKNLLIENEAPLRESYSLFGYRTVDSDFKDYIEAKVELIQSKFNFVDIILSISDGKTLNLSNLPISKQKVIEDVNGDTEYSFSIHSGRDGFFMTMTAEKDRIVLSLNIVYYEKGVIQLGEFNLRAQVPVHTVRYKIHGCVKRKNSGMNTKKTQYIQKIYSSLELPDDKLSIIEKNKEWKKNDQIFIKGEKYVLVRERFEPNKNITNLSRSEILEILKKDQEKLMDLLKKNSELNYLLKTTDITQDKIIATHFPIEGIIELWKNNQNKLNQVLMENKRLRLEIDRKERRIEKIKKTKVKLKSIKEMWLDELKD